MSNQLPTVATGWRYVYNRIRTELHWLYGSLLNMLGFPGFIRPTDSWSQVTRETIKVQVTPLFTIVSINGNDYYFRRRDGVYDGSGTTNVDQWLNSRTPEALAFLKMNEEQPDPGEETEE